MNKIIVSIVLTIILVIGINKITDSIFYVEKPEKSAYQVANVNVASNKVRIPVSNKRLKINVKLAIIPKTLYL